MNDRLGHSVLILGTSLFASWTALCYFMVFTGGSFVQLLQWSPLAIVAGLAGAWLCPYEGSAHATSSPQPPTAGGREKAIRNWPLLAYLAGFMLLDRLAAPWEALWAMQLVGSILVLCHIYRSGADPSCSNRSPAGNGNSATVIVLMLCGAALTLISHRPDIDDAQYLNFVVTAMDFPQDALYSRSGLWPDPSMPLEYPIYRLHSYELLVAALSQVTGLDHQALYYLALPALFGAAAVLVHWQLAHYLLPRVAISILIIWLTLIIALGETHRAFGNFAFVRLFQGKAVLVTIALPFCLLLGLRFAESPGWRRGLALGMIIVCSLGLSSSALVTVPLIVGATGAAALLNMERRNIKFIMLGAALFAAGFAAIGAAILSDASLGSGLYGGVQPSVTNGLHMVLGDGLLGTLVLGLLPLAALFVADKRRGKIFSATILIFVLTLLNPWTAPFLAEMFDLALQWRIFWALPLVLSAALALAGLSNRLLADWPRVPSAVLPGLTMVTLLLLSNRSSLSEANGVTIGMPEAKVAPFDHALARDIVDDAPGRPAIYAPVSISAWVTTFRNHPYPAFVRIDYFSFADIQQHAGVEEINRRKRLFDILEGHDEYASLPNFLQEQLANDEPRYVVYPREIAMAKTIGAVLAQAHYHRERRGPYEVWRSVEEEKETP